MRVAFAALACLVLACAGCISPPDGTPPPPLKEKPLAPPFGAFGTAPCPPTGAAVTDFAIDATPLASWTGASPGLARDGDGWTWTWRDVAKGAPSEDLGRASGFALYKNVSTGAYLVCGEIALVSHDPLSRAGANLTLRVHVAPRAPIPNGSYVVLVNWDVGCDDCGSVTHGNTSATFTRP
ncbi:MAG: hypothetical protein ACYDCK_05965 [Thermoplasmatota archaeon]